MFLVLHWNFRHDFEFLMSDKNLKQFLNVLRHKKSKLSWEFQFHIGLIIFRIVLKLIIFFALGVTFEVKIMGSVCLSMHPKTFVNMTDPR